MIPNELRHTYSDPFDIPMAELQHFEYIGDVPLPNDAYAFETLGDFLAHYGVKGMRWGHRKLHNKYRPVSSTPEKGLVVQRRGIAGHLPFVGGKKKLSANKTQKLADQLGMHIRVKDVKKHDRWMMGQSIMAEMTKRHYQDKDLHRKSKKAGAKADDAEWRAQRAEKKRPKLEKLGTPAAKRKIEKGERLIQEALKARSESDKIEETIRRSEERIA